MQLHGGIEYPEALKPAASGSFYVLRQVVDAALDKPCA
ncbi:hypothetical protein BVIET440_60230 [Burkholderia vietnamiensis]